MKMAFQQVDSGRTTWGATKGRTVYGLYKGKWNRLGSGDHVTSGDAGVWMVRGSLIFIRTGIRKNRRLGTGWKRVPGSLKQIDSGPKGIVCGVNSGGKTYCRFGISRRYPWGKRWLLVPGKLKYITCGAYGHWGVKSNNKIYFRTGVTRTRPGGIRWMRVSGRLSQIEAGQYGVVVGVSPDKKIYVRVGVTELRPKGTRWKKVKELNLWSHVTIRKSVLFALSTGKTLYRSSLEAVSGKFQFSNFVYGNIAYHSTGKPKFHDH